MSFSYSDDHSDAISRMRWAVGDTIAPGKVPNETYTALLAAKGDEVETAKAIAAGLAARFALQPDKLSDAGSSISYTDRVSQLNKVAAGGTSSGGSSSGASAAASSGDVATQAVW